MDRLDTMWLGLTSNGGKVGDIGRKRKGGLGGSLKSHALPQVKGRLLNLCRQKPTCDDNSPTASRVLIIVKH